MFNQLFYIQKPLPDLLVFPVNRGENTYRRLEAESGLASPYP